MAAIQSQIKGRFVIPQDETGLNQNKVSFTYYDSYEVSIKWGDGISSTTPSRTITIGDFTEYIYEHTYNYAGIYDFGINGDFPSIRGGWLNENAKLYLTKLEVGYRREISIEAYAFKDCSSLEYLKLWSFVTSIELGTVSALMGTGSALENCFALSVIEVSSNNNNYSSLNGDLYSKDGTELLKYANGKLNISFTTPNTVTKIGRNAFYQSNNLKNITISNNVTEIGNGAFAYGTFNIIWGDAPSITTLDTYSFKYYYGASLTIPKSITLIESNAFQNSLISTIISKGEVPATLETGAIPDTVTSIKVLSNFLSVYRTMWSDYATIITPISTLLVGMQELAYYDTKIKEYITTHSGGSIDLSNYYNKSETNDLLGAKVNKTTEIAGIALSANISAQNLTEALNYDTDQDVVYYIMGVV